MCITDWFFVVLRRGLRYEYIWMSDWLSCRSESSNEFVVRSSNSKQRIIKYLKQIYINRSKTRKIFFLPTYIYITSDWPDAVPREIRNSLLTRNIPIEHYLTETLYIRPITFTRTIAILTKSIILSRHGSRAVSRTSSYSITASQMRYLSSDFPAHKYRIPRGTVYFRRFPRYNEELYLRLHYTKVYIYIYYISGALCGDNWSARFCGLISVRAVDPRRPSFFSVCIFL